MTADDAKIVQSSFKNPEVKVALRKKMYPVLNSSMGIGEESDYWFGTETEILDKPQETIIQVVKSKQQCLDMLDKAFSLLDNPLKEKMNLSFVGNDKTLS